MLVKKLSQTRKSKMLSRIECAREALEADSLDFSMMALDEAMKIANGQDDYVEGEMRYDELEDACRAFLSQTGFLSLSSLLTHIKAWQQEEIQRDRAGV